MSDTKDEHLATTVSRAAHAGAGQTGDWTAFGANTRSTTATGRHVGVSDGASLYESLRGGHTPVLLSR